MALASIIIYLIYKNGFLLLVKEVSVNTRSYKVLIFNLINFKPLFAFLICQLNYLLRLLYYF